MTSELYTDEQLVLGIISNDQTITEYFFYEKCSGLLSYIVLRVFDGRAEQNELLHELFLYLADKDWYKLRQFDFKSKLTTWLSVVAIRFFQKKRNLLIENESTEALLNSAGEEVCESKEAVLSDPEKVHKAISLMTNERYKKVINLLDIQGESPEAIANQLGVTVANLYNIRHRAHQQLSLIIGRKEDWYE